MTLLHVFEWLGQSALGLYMARSNYAFEVAEMLHLLGLAGLGGGVLLINLRILGFGLKSQPTSALWRELRPYLLAFLATSICTGVLLLAAEPDKCYYNTAFRVKIPLLVVAILFSALVQRRFLESRIVAVVSLLLWVGVGLAGRAIGII